MSGLRRVPREYLVLAAITVVLLVVPQFLTGARLEVAIRIVLFAMLGTAWNVMAGYAGLFSFGHAAYFGIGAYSGAYLLVEHGWSPWLGMLVGMVLGAAFAVLTGYLSFRYRLTGAYFVLTTFAFAEMLRLIVLNADWLNAALGYRVPINRDAGLADMQFPPGSNAYYYVILFLLVLTLAATITLMRSRNGYYIVAIRDNEEAAASLGLNPMRYKLQAVAFSGALTAAGGTFYFMFLFFIDPPLAFGAGISVEILLPAIIGGMATLWGPLVGAALLVPLSEFTTALVRRPPSWLGFLQGRSGIALMIFGGLLIAIIIFLPKGVYGTIADRVKVAQARRRRHDREAEVAGV
ncbi:MAG TPA: branched-chain amino acid ABC transporter permease [Egicoccus sp.]|nr:branched-chain amino acid ABC transporter permease [Egicoccus sp.]HSK21993.1 branched-chain amino acid ABC transporter permease [Egicoccus sp.]